ncbi:MAG: hypothetical protein NTX03_01905 [Bacteroidetes bacterium]|nr:hypothetical protein [Bacteroidota bacterium]
MKKKIIAQVGNPRTVAEIASDISFLAQVEGFDIEAAYEDLDAMLELKTADDYFQSERGIYIIQRVLYFMRKWKSEKVKPLREELKKSVS